VPFLLSQLVAPVVGSFECRGARPPLETRRCSRHTRTMPGDYTANLCHRTATGEMVPYEQAPIQASDDRAATQEATQWIDHVRDLIDDGTWLVVKDGARGVYYKKIGAAIMPVRRKRPRDPAELAKLMIDIASGEVTDRPPTKRTKTRKKRASARRGANLQRKT